jgi:iron complex transport system permease protein
MREKLFYFIILTAFVVITPIYLFQGSVAIGWDDLWSDESLLEKTVFWNIRVPRYLLTVISGAGLGLSGAYVQGIFRNPLVEPGLIGISSGGALFASFAIVFFGSSMNSIFLLQGFAFLGAFLVSLIVYFLSSKNGRVSVLTLLLMGIGVNASCGSLMGLLHYLASDSQIRAISFWGLGSLAGASWDVLYGILPFALLPIFAIPFLSRGLNAFILGEREANHLGFSAEKIKIIVLLIVCLSVGAIVSVTGIIGFVGLVVPHIVRIWGKSNHRFLLPASAILGSILLLASDGIAKVIVAPSELSIGILTAGIGSPIFIWILYKRVQEEI